MRVLGIETSCDETAVAIYDGVNGLVGHALHSQIELHQRYGGVVPELASRDHILKLLPLIEDLLENASLTLTDLDAIAYTAGPGLVGALLVGACCAQALGYSLGIPTVPIHHMEGHLLAPLLDDPKPTFPFLALLVSGGHTMLIQANDMGKYQLLGETLDDAAGEAFDKIAKLMGLNYPGGPELAKLALGGQHHRFQFPRPLTDKPGLDFSFSGLKTHALTTLKKLEKSSGEDNASWQDRADVAHAFQEAIVDTLYIKCKRALEHTNLKQVVIAGGVSANLRLREKFRELQRLGVQVYYPRMEFCTDNGAMIAFAGYQRLSKDAELDLKTEVRARWPLNEL